MERKTNRQLETTRRIERRNWKRKRFEVDAKPTQRRPFGSHSPSHACDIISYQTTPLFQSVHRHHHLQLLPPQYPTCHNHIHIFYFARIHGLVFPSYGVSRIISYHRSCQYFILLSSIVLRTLHYTEFVIYFGCG
jgi:hypothetical protein